MFSLKKYICSSKHILSKHVKKFERLYLIIRLLAILRYLNKLAKLRFDKLAKLSVYWLFTFRVILCVDARNKQLSLTFGTCFCLFCFLFLILISEFITLFLARLLLILFYHTFIIFAINFSLTHIYFYTGCELKSMV